MTRFLLVALFLVIWLDGVLGIRQSILPGLSAKNVMLYVVVIWIVLQSAIDGSHGGLLRRRHDYAGLHLAFLCLIVLAVGSAVVCLTILDYPGYSVAYAVTTLKVSAIDHYLLLFVFLVGLRTSEDAVKVARIVLVAMGIGALIWASELVFDVELGIAERKLDGRVGTPIGDAAQTGTIMAFYLPVMIAMGVESSGRSRFAWLATAVICFMVLLATTSRGALTALVVATVVTAWLVRNRITPKHALYAIAGGLVLAVLGYFALDVGYRELLVERLIGQTSDRTAFARTSGRNVIWGTALADIGNSPITILTGHGWKSWGVIYQIASHNEYLEMLFNLGIFALLLQAYIFVYPVRRTLLAARAEAAGHRPILIGFLLGYLAVLVSIFFVNMFDPWLFVWSFTGIMLRLAAGENIRHEERG